ncbi:hypothetical protein [Streptomyces liangshanensis]|uniref:Uncharacterized protein n=1 Tax=Streptomyces liangshanensis TaxID=2717324 RepID=A0A6G9H018_9ACTN|nr:hypothetical protein [Streptomyces liangshanensis]QIQ03882.1 hypothetical protein HA039_17510 [Streptomyces liangshanensis]
MNLRVIGLTAVVVCTALLPFAASAGPGSGPSGSSDPGPLGLPVPLPLPPPGRAPAQAPAPLSAPEASHLTGIDGSAAVDERPAAAGGAPVRTAERCGPEVASPEGIEAQSCVLTGGRDTWARTYYRNATGRELSAVLSLMGPRGRTVQTHCAVAAEDEPATCETPREPSAGGASRYLAMAEFAAAAEDGAEGAKSAGGAALLLRSGSNSPSPGGR